MSQEQILLVYDRECPVCDYYCRVVRIKQSIGELKIVNAREQSAVMAQITEQGLDIDQGMVLKVGAQIYYGADAIHALALISSRSGIFNRFNYWLFKSKKISAFTSNAPGVSVLGKIVSAKFVRNSASVSVKN